MPDYSSTSWVAIRGEFDGKVDRSGNSGTDLLFARAVKNAGARDWYIEAVSICGDDAADVSQQEGFIPASYNGRDTVPEPSIKKFLSKAYNMQVGRIYRQGENILFANVYHHSQGKQLVGAQTVMLAFKPEDLQATPVLTKAVLRFQPGTAPKTPKKIKRSSSLKSTNS